MVTLRQAFLFVLISPLCAACDTVHAPIYNLTYCPIAVVTTIDGQPAFQNAETTIEPGQVSAVLGGDLPTRYSRIIVKDLHGHEIVYDTRALELLRPSGTSDDSWAYSPDGLSFLLEVPPKEALTRFATRGC